MKKFVSIILALCLVCCALPMTALADIPSDQVAGFILRCYTRGLGRDEAQVRANDADGLAYWYEIVKTRQLAPAQVANYFAISQESQDKYPGNSDYIAMLYRLYMEDREYDQGGFEYWCSLLDEGLLDREQINYYFGVSPEFQAIVASYNLDGNNEEPEPQPWNPDISFTTTDMYGTTYTDSIFANAQVTMLNMWAYWCGPCMSELQDLQQLQNDYAGRGFQIFGVSYKNFNDGNISAFEQMGISYPSLIATQSLDNAMNTGAIPTTIFVDRNGHILCSEPYVGSRSYSSWASILEGYLN